MKMAGRFWRRPKVDAGPRIAIDVRLNEPTIGVVWHDGQLVFAGVDLISATQGIDYHRVGERLDDLIADERTRQLGRV